VPGGRSGTDVQEIDGASKSGSTTFAACENAASPRPASGTMVYIIEEVTSVKQAFKDC